MDNSYKKNQIYGRTVLKTHRRITGDLSKDIPTVREILNEVLPTHYQNASREKHLFDIYFNANWWAKNKEQRPDINNQINIPTAYAITRTLNGYVFTDPIKYSARNSKGSPKKLQQVEHLSAMLDYAHNHASTVSAAISSSVCGLGYKLCLPAKKSDYDRTGVAFIINNEPLFPMDCGIVYSDEVISDEVIGFVIGQHYNEKNEVDGNLYTVWTKYHQILFKDGENNGYELVKQEITLDGNTYTVDGYETTVGEIPLVEIERNPFRKGDWEVAIDLLRLKNQLLSNREDDVEQAIDYVLLLMNAEFESEKDKDKALKDRVISLKTADPMNPPSLQILKAQLDQNGIQTYANYVDLLIQECVGIPNRQENGYGGGDTGQAVQYRNGFRDLENNAGLIIPKMDKAELKLVGLCIEYSKNMGDKEIGDLKPFDIRCKFNRSMSDDITASANAFATYVKHGVSYPDAFILSKSGTDAAELATSSIEAYKNGTSYLAIINTKESTQPEVNELSVETTNNGTNG